MKKNIQKRLILLSLSLLIFWGCACGRNQSVSSSESAPETPPSSSESRETLAPASPEAAPSASVSLAESREEAELPEEDPWAEGYYYDEALTKELYQGFASVNTNNTDNGDPNRCMTGKYLEELNGVAEAWLYGGMSDSEAETALKLASFRFDDDPAETERGMRTAKAGVYSLKGNDPETLAERIRLGNSEACFYLFLRAYFNETEERTRVYMINGLIW